MFIDSSKATSFYDKLIETQMIQNYLNAKILSDNDSDQQQQQQSKKFIQNSNFVNQQQQQQSVSLPFNFVMSNLAAFAGARSMLIQPTTTTQISPNSCSDQGSKIQYSSMFQQQQQKNCHLVNPGKQNFECLRKKSTEQLVDIMKKDSFET